MRTLHPSGRRAGLALGLAVVSTLACSGVAGAADTPAAPDHTRELGQFTDWWTPAKYDRTSTTTIRATGIKGTVTDAGVAVFRQNDATVLGVNHAGAASPDQQYRALVDAAGKLDVTLGDGLGPTLGPYLIEGIRTKALPLTEAVLSDGDAHSSTGTTKSDFNFPRPMMRTADKDKGGFGDRSRNGENDLKGLAPQLDITRVADRDGLSANYDTYAGVGPKGVAALSQSFPSGHTTGAYGIGLPLAELLPELGPEIVTRSSEAGNNRVVLGIHYPLDVMGGRIIGHSNIAAMLAAPGYVTDKVAPARKELVDYLTGRCTADGHGTTLAACITETGADDKGGYTNPFVDPVSTAPVTDRASALAAYTARMTYGFDKVGAAGAPARVPAGAAALLATAFPDLTDEQRTAVLAATEIDSGYALDASSDGWQRINLAAALSSTVTLDHTGAVVSVEPGTPAPSVVRLPEPPTSTPEPTPPSTPSSTPSSTPAPGSLDRLTGSVAGLGS